MAKAFADISFTASVKAVQERYGSRESNRFFEQAQDSGNTITERAAAFIEVRDSVYIATVAENGWPYVQHRGGPKGLIKVLDDHHIGFVDYSGNRQYLSVGNLSNDDRVSLFLMDYPNRRRLKIWGRADIRELVDYPELAALLGPDEDYPANPERMLVIKTEALEWNCPQHITPRFSEEEVRGVIASNALDALCN